MHTRTTIALTLLAAVITAAPAAAQQQQQSSQQSQTPDVPPNYPLPPEAVSLFANTIRQLEDIRGITYKTYNIPLRVVDVDQYTQRLRDITEALYPADRRHHITEGLARLGMIDREVELINDTVTAQLSQSALVYDAQADRMLIVMDEIPMQYLSGLARYRLAAVLQDQHFNVGGLESRANKLLRQQPRQIDRALAMRFLIDGEPAYLQFKHRVRTVGSDAEPPSLEAEAEMLKTFADLTGRQVATMARPTILTYADKIENGIDDPILSALYNLGEQPDYIVNPIYAAQNRGAFLIAHLRRIGGWEHVNRAYENPPITTEQGMHPEKLFDEPDQPTTLNLPQFTALKGAGYTLVDSAVHGEFHLYDMLRRWGREKYEAMAAAAGWDGDLYQAWKSPAETYAIILATTWDSEEDAQQFYTAYLGLLGSKYSAAQTHTGSTRDRYHYDCNRPGLEHGWLIHRGREVFIIEGLPQNLGNTVLQQLEAMDVEYVE